MRKAIVIAMGLAMGLAWISGLSSCSKDKEAQSATGQSARKLQIETWDKSGLEKEAIDINKDGREDQWIYKKDGAVKYAQRDFNFDGVIDMTEFYEQGKHVRDEIDLDYDAIVDLIITYKDDIPVKKEYSVDFEGNRHGTQYFNAHGIRTQIDRDTNGDGISDTTEYYREGEDEPYNVEKKQNKKVK